MTKVRLADGMGWRWLVVDSVVGMLAADGREGMMDDWEFFIFYFIN